MPATIAALIIAKNEEEMIANCIETLRWCDEIIVINNESADATVGIAHRLGAKVVTASGTFAELRNQGLAKAKTDWVLYVDADERVTPALAAEIKKVIGASLEESVVTPPTSYLINRQNILYGSYLQHGGWEEDGVVRLFNRESLKTWVGSVHEHAEVSGHQGTLKQSLIHFTHRSVVSGLAKTIEWTPIEADLLYQAGTPPVTVRTLLRKGLMEVWRRAVVKKGYRDGAVGWIEALIQGMNRVLVYMQVWEKQQKPTLPERYQQYEKAIHTLWKQDS
jgi:glycosyltransferase involved in cell wall biosynthesis